MQSRVRPRLLISLIVIGLFVVWFGNSRAETVKYFYDDLHRLIRVEYGDGTIVRYTYDRAGNRLVKATTWYTITATAGANGTITPSGPINVHAGANQAFTIMPNTGYLIGSVTVDGTSVGPVGTYTFTNVSADHTIAATFTAPTTAPGAATLISPSGATTPTPTYTWNAVSVSTWYYLWVNDSTGNRIQQWYTAAQSACAAGTGTCSVTPTTVLNSGAGQWWIQTWNSVAAGPWSAPMAFTVNASPLPAATLISPSGTITTATPTYTWNAVSQSTWYQLQVNDPTGNRIMQWYTAAQCNCGSGTGTCSVTPSTVLNAGACSWLVQTYNSSGNGPWSTPMSFTVNVPAPPPAPTLMSPSGTISTLTPTYTWNALSSAVDYYLWVNDSSGTRIQQWYSAAACGCGSGTGTCSLTPSTVLNAGAGQWWVKARNASGEGPWSNAMAFSIPAPGAATLISPSGTTTSTPTYTWNAVPISTWYQLQVNDSTGNRILQWYTSAETGCASGTGTCSVTPSTVLHSGAGQWWIQTWNNVGAGPWSAPMAFTVP